jgi:hypothetical protein
MNCNAASDFALEELATPRSWCTPGTTDNVIAQTIIAHVIL